MNTTQPTLPTPGVRQIAPAHAPDQHKHPPSRRPTLKWHESGPTAAPKPSTDSSSSTAASPAACATARATASGCSSSPAGYRASPTLVREEPLIAQYTLDHPSRKRSAGRPMKRAPSATRRTALQTAPANAGPIEPSHQAREDERRTLTAAAKAV